MGPGFLVSNEIYCLVQQCRMIHVLKIAADKHMLYNHALHYEVRTTTFLTPTANFSTHLTRL